MNPEDMLDELLRACPSARKSWQEHLDWWKEEDRGYFNDVSVFAHHVVECYGKNETSEFPAFFRLLEEMVSDPNLKVREYVVTGLIEDIQNISSHQSHGYTVFERWLQPASLSAWKEVEANWHGVGSLADMIRKDLGEK